MKILNFADSSQVNPDLTIEYELSESDDTHSQSFSCVIERKGSYLPARRSPETSDASRWDLAAAGMHKRQTGTEALKKLKHVIIQFDAQTSRCTNIICHIKKETNQE